MTRVRPSSEHGFTLIELLVAVTITGFIAAAIGGAFLAFMTNQERAGDQQAIARDQFSLTSWFLADAQSSTAEDTSDTASDSSICASGVPLEAVDTNRNVVQLTWSDGPGGSGTDYEVNYRAERDSLTDPWRLVRYFCESGDPASEVTVVQELLISPPPTFSENRGRLTLQVTSGFDAGGTLRAVGTRHTVFVPDVVGLTVTGAIQALTDAGLRSVPSSPPVPDETVLSQDPDPLTTLGLGSPVAVFVAECGLESLLPPQIEVDDTTLESPQDATVTLNGDCTDVASVQLLIDKDGVGGFGQPGEDHGLMAMSGGPNNWTVALTDGGWDDSLGSVAVQIVLNDGDGDPLDTIDTSVAIN